MSDWTDAEDPLLSAVTALAAELADPIRLTTLQLLAAEGPHTMSQLAGALGISAPRLGNHLARLRAAGLVSAEHTGRHAVYRVAAPGLGEVLAVLSRYARPPAPTAEGAAAGASEGPQTRRAERAPPRPAHAASAADIAHTCYDHAAGLLGVTLFATLVARGAMTPPDGGGEQLTLGADLSAFHDLGVDVDTVDAQRRKLATACLDRTHRLPHLGGALGAALLAALLTRGLVTADDDTRLLTVTDRGRRDLPALVPGFGPT